MQTSGRFFVARELVEPLLREKANEATLCAMPLYRYGFWLSTCIAKVIGYTNDRVNRQLWLAFEGLEPCEVKVSCTVLRGLGVSNAPRLPDTETADR